MSVLYLVDLYFGTNFVGKLLYEEIKKFCDRNPSFGTELILDDLKENGHATLKISKKHFGFGILTPCDVIWDSKVLDLSSKNRTEAINAVKSYMPELVYSNPTRYNDDPVYTCGCST